MKASTERILTTHVGSLPRSRGVVGLLYRKGAGEPSDHAALAAAVAAGVAEAVAKQVDAGVDIVNDGETTDIVGRERGIAGTDCVFGSFAAYSRVDPAIAYKKLRALAEGAALATDRLWRSRH